MGQECGCTYSAADTIDEVKTHQSNPQRNDTPGSAPVL